MTVLLTIGGIVLFCFGGLVGAAWTTQALSQASRKHARFRRRLNEEWQALTDARRARGESVLCARCHQQLVELNRQQLAISTEDDDGT